MSKQKRKRRTPEPWERETYLYCTACEHIRPLLYEEERDQPCEACATGSFFVRPVKMRLVEQV